MRIGVDIRGLLTGKRSGVEQYTLKLLEHLLLIDSENTYVLFYVSYRDMDDRVAHLLTEAPFLRASNVEIKFLRWVNFPLLLHAVWKPIGRPYADKICGGLDIMWLPSPRLLPVSSSCRTVITFHDLIFEIFPQFYTWQSRLWQWQMNYPYLARTADQIISISESTKSDLVRLYNVEDNKITVIHEGVDSIYFQPPPDSVLRAVKGKFRISGDFIYYVGSIEPRKNIPAIIRSLKYLRGKGFDKISLVVSGAKSWLASSVFTTTKELKLKNAVKFTGPVTEAEKIALLHSASSFAFPTFYEGFGLPVLEAMAAGCPAVTSSVSSLPEVVDNAALLVDPEDQDALNLALEKILSNPAFANNLATRGKLQAKKFSWASTAQATLKVFTHGGEQK